MARSPLFLPTPCWPPVLAALLGLGACEPTKPVADTALPPPATRFACGGPVAAFSSLPRGPDAASRLVDVEGVVVANFQGGLGGFVLQSAPGAEDADPSTPEGAFVEFRGERSTVRVGRSLRVSGEWRRAERREDNDWALRSVATVLDCGPARLPDPIRLADPPADWARYSGMRVHLPGPLTITGNASLLRNGELVLAFGGRLFAATETVLPGAPAARVAAANAARSIVVDDGRSGDYPARLWHLPDPVSAAAPYRVGSTVTGIAGVVEHRHGSWRLQLTEPVAAVAQASRPPPPPRTPDTLRLASFNLFNYFDGDGAGGGFPTPRGAATAQALVRQQDKLVAAMAALDADVLALMELENDGTGVDSAAAGLARALAVASRGADGRPAAWAVVPVPGDRLGSDEIAVGLLYRSDRVRRLAAPASLQQPPFDRHSRVPLLQAFAPVAGGTPFQVVVNHFKSKGGCPAADPGNVDLGDGQACFAAVRTASARRLTEWLAGEPLGLPPTQTLVLGDLNAHSREDAIRLLVDRGYVDLLAAPEPVTTFVFAAAGGRLDHALAGVGLAARVDASGVWTINAEELPEFAYDGGRGGDLRLYAPDPWRSSDHDPVWIDLAPGPAP